MHKENISKVSNEHTAWLSSLNFYKEELKMMKGRLTEVAGKNTDAEMAKNAEHFENQITVQTQNIDILHHNIRENLEKLASEAQSNSAGYIDADLATTHDKQKTEYTSLETVINELRHDFNKYAAQWM